MRLRFVLLQMLQRSTRARKRDSIFFSLDPSSLRKHINYKKCIQKTINRCLHDISDNDRVLDLHTYSLRGFALRQFSRLFFSLFFFRFSQAKCICFTSCCFIRHTHASRSSHLRNWGKNRSRNGNEFRWWWRCGGGGGGGVESSLAIPLMNVILIMLQLYFRFGQSCSTNKLVVNSSSTSRFHKLIIVRRSSAFYLESNVECEACTDLMRLWLCGRCVERDRLWSPPNGEWHERRRCALLLLLNANYQII